MECVSKQTTILTYYIQGNPEDILLFHRRRSSDAKSSGKNKKKSATEKGLEGGAPMEPVDLEEVNVEEIVNEILMASEKKL